MQQVDDIKPCYPLFRQDEYKESLSNKQEQFEERHPVDKIQETFIWTTTAEYSDLNFKREALTVNPARLVSHWAQCCAHWVSKKRCLMCTALKVVWLTSAPTLTVISRNLFPAFLIP